MISIVKSTGLTAIVGSFLVVSLFLPAGFITLSIILFFVCACFRSEWAFKAYRYPLLLLPIILFTFYCMGSIFSPDSSMAWIIMFRKLPLIIIPLGFIILDRKEASNSEIILFVFLCACVLCSLFCYGNALMSILKAHSLVNVAGDRRGDYYYYSYRELAMPSGIDPIFLSFYFNLAMVIALRTPFLVKKAIRIMLCGWIAIFVLLLASKIGVLIFGMIVIVWITTQFGNRKIVSIALFIFLSSLVFGILEFPFLAERFDRTIKFQYGVLDSEKWTSTTFRLAIWSCAIEAIRNEPMGYGTAGGQIALEQMYREKKFLRGQVDRFNAQNEYLTTLLDLGAIGGTFLVVMLAIAFWAAVKTDNTPLVCFLIITSLGFCVETVLLRQKGIVFFSFFYSLLFWSPNSKRTFLVKP